MTAGMRGCREPCVKNDSITPLGVQLSPRLIGQLQLWDSASMLEMKGLALSEHFVALQHLPIRTSQPHWAIAQLESA